MSNKKRVNTECVTTFISEDLKNDLTKITDEMNISINEYVRSAIEVKLRMDNNETYKHLEEESSNLLDYWKERIADLEKIEEKKEYDNWVNQSNKTFNGMHKKF